ncbi:unnamed protein product [Moneuplotes crassus]|uniref:Uncharacterized protein n=2 Tax=Euplotes crassus TaxID=5936 RepID=A0AAD1U8W0_EUPCR|nr:unnamed protein product [Moneuplotes crassus]
MKPLSQKGIANYLPIRQFARKARRVTGLQKFQEMAQKSKEKSEQPQPETQTDLIKEGESFEIEDNHYFQMLDTIMKNKENPDLKDGFDPNNLTPEELSNAIKDAEAEMSDLEHEERTNSPFRFVSPPSTHSEYLKTISEADARYKVSKKYLDGAMSKSYYEDDPERMQEEVSLQNKLPPNFMISTLVYPKTQSEVILCGVEKSSYIHAHMLSDLLLHFNPDVVFTQISPDEPYFIRRPRNYDFVKNSMKMLGDEGFKSDNSGYKGYWKAFIRGQSKADFYVNPGPHFLSDLTIFKSKNDMIIDQNLTPCTKEFDIGANIAYTKGSVIFDNELLPDCFLTPLIHQYNNLDTKVQCIVGGYPILALRDMVVRNHTFDEIYDNFKLMMEMYQSGEVTFDPTYLFQDYYVKPQAEYMAEVLRQACHSSKQYFAVVDKDMVPFIEKQWRDLGETRKITDFYSAIPSNTTDEAQSSKTYVEYVQKHALFDVMFDSFVHNNFMKYSFFPFNGVGLYNWASSISSTIEYWNHFYGKYLDEFQKIDIPGEEKDLYSKKLKYQENYGDESIFK